MRRVLLLALLLSFTFWFPFAYKRWTHPFRINKCLVDWPANPAWENGEPGPEIVELFSQPFRYLAKGKQSYVFLSADGRHVLKLFRFDTCKTPVGQACGHWLRKQLGMRQKVPRKSFAVRAQMTFDSCWLCYAKAQKQTGVEWVHLNPKAGKIPPFTVIDRMGRKIQVDPARVRLAVQRKAEPLLRTMKESGDREALVRSFHSLLDELAALKFSNDDEKLGANFGVLDGRVIALDIGNFFLTEQVAEQETERYKARLDRWLGSL